MLKKMPIEWHIVCWNNQKKYLKTKEDELERMKDEFSRFQENHNFYTEQISEAKRLGKDGFNSDKFMRKIPRRGRNDQKRF